MAFAFTDFFFIFFSLLHCVPLLVFKHPPNRNMILYPGPPGNSPGSMIKAIPPPLPDRPRQRCPPLCGVLIAFHSGDYPVSMRVTSRKYSHYSVRDYLSKIFIVV